MDIRRLRFALAVADERSFTRAAERLFVSQPGLSRAVRELETEIGFEIFDRSGRQLELTTVGSQAIARARAAVGAFDQAMREINALSGRLHGPLRVGISIDTWPFVAGSLSRLRTRHTDLRLELRAGDDSSVARAVDRHELDAAIVWWPDVDRAHETRSLTRVPTLLAVPAGSHADRELAALGPDADRAVGNLLHGIGIKMFERRLGPATYDALLETLDQLADLPVVAVPCMEAGIESAQAAMLHAAATDGTVTICTPEHFARAGDTRLAAHPGLMSDAQITMIHTARAGALARALAADIAGSTATADG